MYRVDAKEQPAQLLELFDREREVISLELHDNVLQNLASALHHIQAAYQDYESSPDGKAKLLKAFLLVRQSMDAARGLMGNLRPPVLDRMGLLDALSYELQQLQEETKWQVSFEKTGGSPPTDLQPFLYQIIREAVINARKHSDSHSLRVSIRCQQNPPEVVAEVQDTGKGFCLSEVPRDRMGLVSMQMRAKLLRGVCDIQSAPGKGTTVVVRLPVGRNLA